MTNQSGESAAHVLSLSVNISIAHSANDSNTIQHEIKSTGVSIFAALADRNRNHGNSRAALGSRMRNNRKRRVCQHGCKIFFRILIILVLCVLVYLYAFHDD